MEIDSSMATEKMWEVLLIKIKQPNLFLPATDVVHRPSDDHLGTYVEFTIRDQRVKVNVYVDEANLEAKFIDAEDHAEIVHKIHVNPETDSRSLEFYRRDSATKERMHWQAPKKTVLDALQKCLDMAKRMTDGEQVQV